MQQSFTTAQVAGMAGVHRDTLLRWLRERSVPEPRRDRHGWRVFTAREAAAIADFAKGGEIDAEAGGGAPPRGDAAALARLAAVEWDFASAKTGYLTHNLHPYPAKFIPQIPNALIQELSSIGETVADVFCGSGTTLLEALLLKRSAIGIDANPLAALISRAKTTPLTDSEFREIEEHRSACERTLAKVESRTGDLFFDGRPFRSSGWRPAPKVCDFWFAPHVVEELAELRALAGGVRSEAAGALCMVALAAIVVSVSKQDSDTRYVRREKSIETGDTVRRYLNQLDSAVRAVREMSGLVEARFSCEVLDADVLKAPDTEPFDLVVTSPPYPNAYSYHLYHRTRLLWLGHDPEPFKKSEIGSHRKYSAKGRDRAAPETFRKEFESIFQWLRGRLRDRRYACFVIGDSTIDGKRVDNASLLAEAGAGAGFREAARIGRTIAPTRKAFNPRMGGIKTENVLILRKA